MAPEDPKPGRNDADESPGPPARADQTVPALPLDELGGSPRTGPSAPVDRTVAAARPVDHGGETTQPSTARPEEGLVGTEVGGCLLEELIGTGAMGAVYRARQLSLDREVAVKTIRPDLVADPRAFERFRREARTVGKFNTPYVVAVHDVGEERGIHYLVMEFVRGVDLRELAKKRPDKRLPTKRAIRYLRQCCEGLKEAQRLGVIHRDIKPDNLLLGEGDHVKIADFGIAKVADADIKMTMTAELTGTPLYMSPEQCRGESDLDFRTDMYSLGATFYYLVTGMPPAKGSSLYELIQTKTRIRRLSPAKAIQGMDESHPLSRIIEVMTAQKRGERYPSYDALITDLERVADGESPLAQPVTGVQPLSKEDIDAAIASVADEEDEFAEPRRSGALIAALVVLLLAGGGAAGYFFWWLPQQSAAVEPAQVTKTGPAVVVGGDPEAADQQTAEPPPAEPPTAAAQPEAAESGGVAPVVVPLPIPTGTVPSPVPGPVPAAATGEPGGATEAAVALEARATKIEALETCERDFRGGAAPAGLRPVVEPLVNDSDDEVQTRAKALFVDLEAADVVRTVLADSEFPRKPTAPAPPFDEVTRYLKALVRAFDQEGTGDAYAGWRDTVLAAKRDDAALRPAAQTALGDAWVDAQARAGELSPDATGFDAEGFDAALRGVRTALRVVRDGQARLVELYGLADADLVASADDLDGLARGLEHSEQVAAWNGQARTLRDELTKADLGTWLRQKDAFDERRRTLEQQAKELNALGGGDLTEVDAARASLVKHAANFNALRQQTLRGDFAGTTRAIPTSASGPLGALRRSALALDRAFASLRRDATDTQTAATDFDGAERAMREIAATGVPVGDLLQRISEYTSRLEELQKAVRDMAVVPGGKALIDGRRLDVATFYLARTEISRGEFRAFAAELEEHCGSGSDTERLARAEQRTDVVWPSAEELDRTIRLGRRMTDKPSRPATALTYWSALGFARWRGHSLPTRQEWWLAAFGPGRKASEYPWGDQWPSREHERNPFNSPVDVDADGIAARFEESRQPVHHLAGNAAEWLLAAGNNGFLIGGGFLDNERGSQSSSAKKAARGEPREWSMTKRPRADAGARTVLRPRDFFGELWPR